MIDSHNITHAGHFLSNLLDATENDKLQCKIYALVEKNKELIERHSHLRTAFQLRIVEYDNLKEKYDTLIIERDDFKAEALAWRASAAARRR